MFNNSNCCGGYGGYSLSDIAAVSGNNGRNSNGDDCFGGNGAW